MLNTIILLEVDLIMNKVECLYENNNVLKVIINIKLGFSKTIGLLLFSILMLPTGLFIILLLLFNI